MVIVDALSYVVSFVTTFFIQAELKAKRIKSVVLLVSWGTIPLGSLTAGYLLDWTSPETTALVLVGIMVAIAAIATL